jgi:hypothetical protein
LDPLIKSQLLYQLSYAPEMRRAGVKARSRRRLAKWGGSVQKTSCRVAAKMAMMAVSGRTMTLV